MHRLGSIVLILLALTWWSPTPAAAKVEHFKDNQGTLHITNVKPEDQAKPEAAPAAPTPLKLQVPPPPPPGMAAPPAGAMTIPGASPEPEAPQAEAPAETEIPPHRGNPNQG